MAEDNNNATFVVLSGDMDKVFASFIMATGTAAAGMDTTMFFTFWGLNAIKTGKLAKSDSFLGKMMGIMNRGGVNRLNPSKFSFGGIGRLLFKKMMADKNVVSIPELRDMAIELGVHMVACKMSMDVMGITKDDLIPEVEGVVGVASLVNVASRSKIQMFI
jgi:peroxiredoxin family protein